MKEITMEKMQELETDIEFMRKMKAAKSAQEIISIMAEKGIDITEEELTNGYHEALNRFEQNGYMDNGELTEHGLDLVVGGINEGVYGVGFGAGVAGCLLLAGGPFTWGAAALWAGGLALMSGSFFMK